MNDQQREAIEAVRRGDLIYCIVNVNGVSDLFDGEWKGIERY